MSDHAESADGELHADNRGQAMGDSLVTIPWAGLVVVCVASLITTLSAAVSTGPASPTALVALTATIVTGFAASMIAVVKWGGPDA